MTSPLENLSGPGKPLAKELPDARETAGLNRSALLRLKDACNSANSLESRFDLADNAAHALCLAALRWHGYRPGNRYVVFQVLPHTLGLGPEVWRVLAKCHDIRGSVRSDDDGCRCARPILRPSIYASHPESPGSRWCGEAVTRWVRQTA